MNGKEYGLAESQWMLAVWTIRAYAHNVISSRDACIVNQALSTIPELYRARVLSDILERVNGSCKDQSFKAMRDKVIITVAAHC